MKLHELQPAPGSVKNARRIGRGIGSGMGKTSTKGHKGQKARSGTKKNGFEGGQMPLARRLPKIGFHNNFGTVYTTVNIGALEQFEDGTEITAAFLKEEGVIAKIEKDGLKILGGGELTKKLQVKAAKFTKTAEEAIKAAGGTVEVG